MVSVYLNKLSLNFIDIIKLLLLLLFVFHSNILNRTLNI